MAFQLSDHLVTDDLTILLCLIAASLFLLSNLYKPQPLVHPILLGRQSDVARVRNPGQSAVYRNYGTGMMGRLPVRPAKDINLLTDLVKTDFDAPRTLWSTKITNPELRERFVNFGTGLIRLAGLAPKESNVLLLLDDSIEFLIADLALASHSIASFTLTSLDLLTPVLERHPPSAIITHGSFLPQLLELIYDSAESSGHHTIIVVGEAPTGPKMLSGVRVLKWEDIEKNGRDTETIISAAPDPNDIFTVSFFSSRAGELRGAQLTHQNLTAGVAAVRVLLPLSSAVSPLDTVVSAHSMNTAYGRSLAYMAVFEGTSFATLNSTKIFTGSEGTAKDTVDLTNVSSMPIPFPTITFLKPAHLESLTMNILSRAKESSGVLFQFAWRHKLSGLSEGFLTKDSLWDRIVFEGARQSVVGVGAGTLRGVVVSGGPLDASALPASRVALSIPIVNVHTNPLVPGPVLASHPLDLQSFPVPESGGSDPYAQHYHCGPPSINVEAKLLGVKDEGVEAGGDPEGVLFVRGPSVGKELMFGEDSWEQVNGDEEGWAATGVRARVASNGTFKVAAA
ncbi:acetyl-CoA synthetase-like protein [Neolentinus lepideus HHB14362 ss-1]|uniref:Acetyl-CoA synthetase-like protein n=1 Tax=Neolentinus lepideus HHB14362 ss-1 TaxID=1314782 RepID=A0A165UPY1_9AGAM|nr:acetyl-CoA synthetase-like protein [Neolentinus lepideus HHB14362 ss-1]